jgi:hypothetical protein
MNNTRSNKRWSTVLLTISLVGLIVIGCTPPPPQTPLPTTPPTTTVPTVPRLEATDTFLVVSNFDGLTEELVDTLNAVSWKLPPDAKVVFWIYDDWMEYSPVMCYMSLTYTEYQSISYSRNKIVSHPLVLKLQPIRGVAIPQSATTPNTSDESSFKMFPLRNPEAYFAIGDVVTASRIALFNLDYNDAETKVMLARELLQEYVEEVSISTEDTEQWIRWLKVELDLIELFIRDKRIR